MSVEPSSTPGRPEEQDPDGLRSGAEHAASAAGIQHQAARIIDAVLADTAPEHDRARELLRQHMAAHPGRPELALMEHLTALKALSGLFVGTPDDAVPVQRDWASGE
ncbi:hypothetical protein AB4089_08395 [Arthrobacter sp. 2MCAF15]|uniref:hypothetical protein n=1 Tax=Arthrobacter sp. 2MCAF15 TaxID=3232984 RepID=UPI003F91F717